jgi:ankyrin repeat protein
VLTLLQGGADVDKTANNGYTPLCMACQQGHLPVVQALLEGGADVDKAMDDGATPLYIASQMGHLHVVQALLWTRLGILATPL